MSNVWTLLIADDCQEDREVYREYLSGDPEQAYQFIEAGSAEAGLALCQKQHCDAILLDFQLPDMTGLEFLDHLKRQSRLPLPVIMLTGQGDERVAVQAMKRGAQDYLVKQNLEPDTLQLTVRNVIHQSRLQNHFNPQSDRQQVTAEVALHLHQSLNLEEILQTAVTEVQQVLECDRVVIYQATAPTNQVTDCSAIVPTLVKRCETGAGRHAQDPLQRFVAFLSTQPLEFGRSEVHRDPYLIAPVMRQSSVSPVWGLLVACQDAAQRQWQPDEIRFLNDLTRQMAIAVQQSEQFTQAIAALEAEKQLNALKSQLVSTVSHEYRSPLSSILAAATTLKLHRNKLPEAKQQRFLHLIETKARQMAQLVDDLLVLETFESGKVNFTPLPFELLQFISDLLDEQRQGMDDRHELVFKITGNTRGFSGDRQLLRLILMNLLSNAVKYSPDGGAVEVHLVGTPSAMLIEVKDEGIGILEAEQAHIFQSFCRGSNVDTIPGTGLGLAIVKACVDLHGGTITLNSQAGEGTQFTVCLPKRLDLVV
jgi:signal transduction histidine kinase/DNA-binding response OmpR family regulator